MKKEDLKAAITQNFANNEFAVAMEKNANLFQEYENVAGKRSLASIVSYWRKKAGATEAIEEEQNLAPVEETITSEEVGSVGDILGTTTEEPKKEEKVEEPARRFALDEAFDLADIKSLLESENKVLKQYCIVKEEFKQVSDEERFIKTSVLIKADGLGWEKFDEVTAQLGGKKGTTERKAGSFWKSNCGLPVGEEITKHTIFKIGDALKQFAFRNNESAITSATCF